MRNFWYIKLFDSVSRELASRGHHVHFLAEGRDHDERWRDWNDVASALAEEHHKDARMAEARRRKQRAAFHARLSAYLRRVTRPFSTSR